MSPQPTKPASSTDAPDTPAANGTGNADAAALAALTDENTTAGRQVARAMALEKERHELGEKIAKNRDYLRLMDANDELTPEQGEWLDGFYPEKEKGSRRSDEEIERTRKLKEQARKS